MRGNKLDLQLVETFIALINATEQAISLFDETDKLRYANAAFRELAGIESDEHPTWSELMRLSYERKKGPRIETDDFEVWLASARGRRGKSPFRFNEADLHDGRWSYVGETTLPNGWMMCIFSDITNLATSQRKLRYQRDIAQRESRTDHLTGLSNRRSMFHQFEDLSRTPPDTPIVAVLLDIDFFKSVNDRYGHESGDEVLRHFSAQLQQYTRRGDLAGRIGGEEFLLVLPNAQVAGACALMDRLFSVLAASSPLPDHPEFRYSFSAGIVSASVAEPIQVLLRNADEALYEAKSNGRNQYRIRTISPTPRSGTKSCESRDHAADHLPRLPQPAVSRRPMSMR
jgi:diguanylate cyclase (GGDEF)-like protein